MANVSIYVHPIKVTVYRNEYTKKLENKPLKDSINIDPLTCVYKKWETTCYELPSMPTAHGL
jgi:hypothetical protein